jgi:hypothetical protein
VEVVVLASVREDGAPDAAPSIGADGTVAYTSRAGGSGTSSLYLRTKGQTTRVGPFPFAYSPAVNGEGQAALAVLASTGNIDVYRVDGTSLVEIGRSSSNLRYFSDVSIDGMGNVIFRGAGADGNASIYAGDGATLTTLAEPSNDFETITSSRANDAGDVAFVARDASSHNRLFVLANGQLATIAEDGVDGISRVDNIGAFNDAGTVLFWGGYDIGGGSAYRTFASEVARPVPRATDPVQPKGIDDTGALATDFGTITVFPPAGTARIILARGDPLFGSVVTAVSLSSQGFRGHGQLAFMVELEDTRRAVVRVCLATP